MLYKSPIWYKNALCVVNVCAHYGLITITIVILLLYGICLIIGLQQYCAHNSKAGLLYIDSSHDEPQPV